MSFGLATTASAADTRIHLKNPGFGTIILIIPMNKYKIS